jgi:hypothetical protein
MRRPSLHSDSLSVIVQMASAARRARVMPKEAARDSITSRKASRGHFAINENLLPAGPNRFLSDSAAPIPFQGRFVFDYFSL